MENENEPMVPAESPEDSFLWLRRQLGTTLVILIVVVAALDIFLLRQVVDTKREMKGLRAQVDDYTKTNGAPVEFFLQRTVAYAESHDDFRPLLAKYGLIIVSNPPPAKPALAPLAPSPAPKK